MKLYDAREALTQIFGLHEIAAERYVNALQETGALPVTTASIDAEHTARLTLAMLAAPTPSEAVNALATFESLELLVLETRERADEQTLTVREAPIACAEDVPPAFGDSRLFDLSSALVFALETGQATEIAVRRNLAQPLLIIGTTAEDRTSVRWLYGLRHLPSGLLAAVSKLGRGEVDTWVTLSGAGIQMIAALLAGRPPVAVAEGEPAPIFH